MTDKIKNIVVTIAFIIVVYGLFLINVFKAPTEVSNSERRKLAQFPEVSVESITTTKFMKGFADYAVDQFVWRDEFRTIKARFLYDVLKQKDNNGIYIADGHASKTIPTMKTAEIKQTVLNLNRFKNQKIKSSNVYYSIIPDKNYFLADKNGYPHFDYNDFKTTVRINIDRGIKYIDLFNELNLDDFYTTDIHWKQENIVKVANKLINGLNGVQSTTSEDYQTYIKDEDFTVNELYPFYGNYYGQSALPLKAETLKYLTSSEDIKVKILDEEKLLKGVFELVDAPMYNEKDFNSIDPYNLYLAGPKAIITMENANARTNKELIIFRDSFGSSLAPLMTPEYSKITLIDLRYIASGLLDNVVEFNENQDVLFIYSTEVLNNGSILKF